jgi:hypothetical protein
METGCSATQGFVPAGLDREVFQAFEVCRRLGGALASGATLAGWHSWMSGDTGAFAGHGLRVDTGSEDAPAEDATQRLGWFLFQRLASILADQARGSFAVEGAMVLPEVADRAELVSFLRSEDAHAYVVFRYRGSFTAPNPAAPSPLTKSSFSYAWLVLRDSSFIPTRSSTLSCSWTDPSTGGTAILVPLVPYATSGSATEAGLPVEVADFDPSTEIEIASPLALALDPSAGPVLLLSDAEISWAVG